jgi:SRSO17 transposase
LQIGETTALEGCSGGQGMDGQEIRRLEPLLADYLEAFADCFTRRDTRAHFPVYVRGQLSELPRKSVEPMALAAGTPVRTLQEFLTHLTWDEERMRQRVARIVAQEHGEHESIGIIDETGWVKKGKQTPGVQRQYCGSVGKQENSIITVHLGYAAADFHCLLDGDLYLPQSWSDDRPRCRRAGIPDDVVYRPKTEVALELYDRAVANGVHFEWLTFDEWYGGKPPFLRALKSRGQKFVAEIPKDFTAWIKPPRVTTRPFHRRRRGGGRKVPRLLAGSTAAQTVEHLAQSHPALAAQRWQTWRIKDTQKGPLVWRVKHVLVHVKDEQGLPKGPYHLLVCYHPFREEIKYFLSNAPASTPLPKLLRVAFGRWRIERCFEDGKGEVGLDHWEGRRWLGLKRHLILTSVSYLFLAKVCQRLRGEKCGVDRVPGPAPGRRHDPRLATGRTKLHVFVQQDRPAHQIPPTPQRPGPRLPHARHDPQLAPHRHQVEKPTAL